MSKVIWDPKAQKNFARLAKQDPRGADQVLDGISLLLRNPRPAGAHPYGKNWYRIHMGFYRVIYEIKSEKPVIISVEHVGRGNTP
ncbi:type II toxin-antitoxin system RelE family toxin [Streptomyces specialis]|uniref:type II toxin-antitoxin system RelE family toxin n=1 Tax=Streptomyces specialis TaxID=498367 RepID=UPI00073E1A7A|nr:type II toxin-antitoxin system RelE/ParE family toxin [Streptomyces specialis]